MWIWLRFSCYFFILRGTVMLITISSSNDFNIFKVFNLQQIREAWLKKNQNIHTLGIKRTYKIEKIVFRTLTSFPWQVYSCLVWAQPIRVSFPSKRPQVQIQYSMASVWTRRLLNETLSKYQKDQKGRPAWLCNENYRRIRSYDFLRYFAVLRVLRLQRKTYQTREIFSPSLTE